MQKVVKYFDMSRRKCDFHVKTRCNSLSNPQKNKGTAPSTAQAHITKNAFAISVMMYEKFYFDISCISRCCILVGSSICSRRFVPFSSFLQKHQHPFPTGGRNVLLMLLLWMIMVTKYFALETFFDSIVIITDVPLSLSILPQSLHMFSQTLKIVFEKYFTCSGNNSTWFCFCRIREFVCWRNTVGKRERGSQTTDKNP